MSQHGNTLPLLSERATLLVEYLVRYTLAVLPILERMFPELSREALRKFLERLAEDEWISKHQLPGTCGSYWALSARACHRLGLKRRTSALRQGPLVKHCLQNLFFAANPNLRLLTSMECQQTLPQIYRRGNSSQYFLDTETTSDVRLGWLLIDDAKRPLRIYTKAKEIVVTRKANPALYELCIAGRFRIAVATTTAAKAEKIRKLVAERPFRDVPVDIVPVADAFPLLLLAPRN